VVDNEVVTDAADVDAARACGLDVRLLGPIEIASADGRRLQLGTRKQRAVLTILALGRGQIVSADRLVDELWGDEPPSRALSSLYPYISNLRRLLEPQRLAQERPSVLVSAPPGYALQVPPRCVDMTRFEDGARRAVALLADSQFEQARACADLALGEWHGPALGEFADEPFAVAESLRLEELRLAVTEDLFAARLGCGDTRLSPDVERFLAAHPIRERSWAILMRSLYAAGLQSDALRAFQRARLVLGDELGVEPGPELRELEGSILRQDPALSVIRIPSPGEPAQPALVSRPPPVVNGAVPASSPGDELAGRSAAVAIGVAALDDATAGKSRTLLVSGEAGIGKTRLVQVLCNEAVERGFRIATGLCDDEGTPPFGPWNQVLAALGDDGIGGDAGTADTADVEKGTRRLVELVGSRLRARLQGGPLVVVVEDLHWADRSSLKCFEHVTQHFRTDQLLLVGTARDESVAEVRHTLGGLARSAAYVRIELEGIPRTQIRRLAESFAGRSLGDAELDVIVERTAGNPFFVIELARWLGRHGTVGDGVPTGVVDVVRRQVMRLPERVVDVLVTAAVAGQTFDLEVVALAAQLTVDELFDLLDVAVISRLIEPVVDSALEYGFTHALVRDAILLDLAPLRRARIHHRIAEAIAGRSPSSPELAVHRWEARTVAPDKARLACRYAARAAEAAYAVVDATRWWERALELERTPDSERARVLLALGRSLGRMERLEERPSTVRGDEQLTTDALRTRGRAGRWALLLESIDIALQVGDVETAAAAATEVGSGWNAWHWCGFRSTPTDVNRRLEAVLEVVGMDRARARAAILANLAIGRYNDEAAEASDTLSREAVDVARSTGEDQLLAHALLSRALAIERPGRDPARRECVEEVLELAGAIVEQQASALLILAAIELRAGDRLAAESHLAAVRRLARRHGLLQEDIQTQIFEITLAVVDGDPRRAEAIAVDAIQRGAGRMGSGGPIGFLALYSMRLAQGRLAELVEDARVLAPELGVAVLDLVAPALLAAGQSDEAALLARGPDASTDVPRDWYWLGENLLRAQVAEAVGPEELVARQYQLLLPHAGSVAVVPGFVALGVVDVMLGRLARAMGDRDAAARHFDAGAGIARRVGASSWAIEADEERSAIASTEP
jgi:DNA-binding SARP family transcriptional activator/tetratricopeptide (TPR) repeat protein